MPDNNFWQKLKERKMPIYALAPMAGITDSAFRRMCKKFGADVLYSEMASAAALNYSPEKTLQMLKFDESERPYVIQLFGGEPEHFKKAAKIITEELKPDGIDINFGCPVPKVTKQGAGIALFKDLKRSKKVIENTIGSTNLPVSIKTRSQVEEISILDFLDNIKDLNIQALMVHGRTPAQGFDGPVNCDIIKEAKRVFKGIILVNGGVQNFYTAKDIIEKTGADGLSIAQGALGRPWIFKAIRTGQDAKRSSRAIMKEALEHAELAFLNNKERGIVEMRKHLCWYMQGLPGARVLRERLVKVNTIEDIRKILKSAN